MCRRIFVIFGLFLVCVIPSPVQGMEIQATITGFNDLEQGVIEAAIQEWEDLIEDDIVITVNINKANIPGGGDLGVAHGFAEDAGGTPLRADITIDDDGAGSGWFVDETPEENEEFDPGDNPSHFVAKSGSGADGKVDMLSIAKHELKHAIGFTIAYTSLRDRITDPGGGANRTFTGEEFTATLVPGPPPNRGTHLDDEAHPKELMNTAFSLGERKLESQLDCQILSDAFGYEIIYTYVVPAFGTAGLIILGAAMLFVIYLARRRKLLTSPAGAVMVVLTVTCLILFIMSVLAAEKDDKRKPQRSDEVISEIILTQVTSFSRVDTDTLWISRVDDTLHWGRITVFYEEPSVEISGFSTTFLTEYEELWDALVYIDAWNMQDAEPAYWVEDASTFIFEFASGDSLHSFSAYAIGLLDDERYLHLYQMIMAFFETLSSE